MQTNVSNAPSTTSGMIRLAGAAAAGAAAAGAAAAGAAGDGAAAGGTATAGGLAEPAALG